MLVKMGWLGDEAPTKVIISSFPMRFCAAKCMQLRLKHKARNYITEVHHVCRGLQCYFN